MEQFSVLHCSANTNATGSLSCLCLSDVIDVDMKKHHRRYKCLSLSQVYKRHLLRFGTPLFYILYNVCRCQ